MERAHCYALVSNGVTGDDNPLTGPVIGLPAG